MSEFLENDSNNFDPQDIEKNKTMAGLCLLLQY